MRATQSQKNLSPCETVFLLPMIAHFALCALHFALCALHFALCALHFALQTHVILERALYFATCVAFRTLYTGMAHLRDGFLVQINFYLCQSKYCHTETASQFEHVYLAYLPPGDASAAQQTGGFCPEKTDIRADPAVTNRGYDSA